MDAIRIVPTILLRTGKLYNPRLDLLRTRDAESRPRRQEADDGRTTVRAVRFGEPTEELGAAKRGPRHKMPGGRKEVPMSKPTDPIELVCTRT